MVTRIGGFRRKTRTTFQRPIREKGKVALSKYLQTLNEGEKVLLHVNSTVHKGLYYPRFHGRVGTVLKKRGACYEISVFDGNKEKMVIVHPVHLRKVNA